MSQEDLGFLQALFRRKKPKYYGFNNGCCSLKISFRIKVYNKLKLNLKKFPCCFHFLASAF